MNKTDHTYVLVVGLGRSGLAMARFLNQTGLNVVATDINPSLAFLADELNQSGITTEIGFHDPKTFDNAHTIFISPGIPATLPCIRDAVKKGVPLSSELDIFSKYNHVPVVAITGTNGKTTTTTLISDMLIASGMKVFTGGNIGIPLLQSLLSKDTYDWIVAEISSFQLDTSDHFKPDIGILLNISKDHLDRYQDYRSYYQSKWSLFKNQSAEDIAIINRNIDEFDTISRSLASGILEFPYIPGASKAPWGAIIETHQILIHLDGKHVHIDLSQSKLKGNHNRENMAAAALAALCAGGTFDGIQQAINRFQAIPHRMEYTATIDSVDYYNDSKATNTDAVIRAIDCFSNNLILIMGGREKNTDFSLLRHAVKQSVKTIIAIGETRQKIKSEFSDICHVIEATSMANAVAIASENAVAMDTVLLAPACASFDMYDNYAARGDDFKSHVKALES